jgi:uncharacterized protein YciI
MIICETTVYLKLPEEEVGRQHRDFLRKLGDQGKLLMAGRFADAKGAMILWNTTSVNEARELAEKDPYVKQGLVTFELREWPVSFDYSVRPPKYPST